MLFRILGAGYKHFKIFLNNFGLANFIQKNRGALRWPPVHPRPSPATPSLPWLPSATTATPATPCPPRPGLPRKPWSII